MRKTERSEREKNEMKFILGKLFFFHFHTSAACNHSLDLNNYIVYIYIEIYGAQTIIILCFLRSTIL